MNRNVRRVFGGLNDWPSDNAVEFIAWFQRQIDAIPATFRSGATVRISAQDDEPTLVIEWVCPETPIEERARLDDESRRRYL